MVEKESAEDKTESGGGTDSNRKKLVRKRSSQKKYKGRMSREINLGNTRHLLMTLHGWLRQSGEGGEDLKDREKENGGEHFSPPPPVPDYKALEP